MRQPDLLSEPDVETIPSPLCAYQDCRRRGRCTLGPPIAMGDGTVNRALVCRSCGRRGELSEVVA